MFQTYFGGSTTGRLARLPFLGFLILLLVLSLLFGLGIAFGIGVAVILMLDGPAAARDYLEAALSLPLLGLLALLPLAALFAKLNLMAKRVRDMGLPGWRVLLPGLLVSAGLWSLLPGSGDPQAPGTLINGAWNGLFLLALLTLPSGLFGPRPQPQVQEATSTEPPPAVAAVGEGAGEVATGATEESPVRDEPDESLNTASAQAPASSEGLPTAPVPDDLVEPTESALAPALPAGPLATQVRNETATDDSTRE